MQVGAGRLSISKRGRPWQEPKSYGPALIDDHTPTPAHALFSWSRLGLVALSGAVLWIAPMFLLWSTLGWDHTYTQMAWFLPRQPC